MNLTLPANITVQDSGNSILVVIVKNEEEARKVLSTLTTIVITDGHKRVLFAEELKVVVAQPQVTLELVDLAPPTEGLVCAHHPLSTLPDDSSVPRIGNLS